MRLAEHQALAMRISVALALAMTAAPAVADPAPATWITKVDKSKFRVTLKDNGVVEVVNKAFLTGRTMDVRDQMRTAVHQATGCELVDELWFDAKLKGKLSCGGTDR